MPAPTPISEKRTSAVTFLKSHLSLFDDSQATPRYEPFPPYVQPPSYSYDSDDDSDATHAHTPSFATTLRLRASIATTPEDRLREIMLRLVERNPGFQHAVSKALATSNLPSPNSSPRRKRRRSRRSSDTTTSTAAATPTPKCINCGNGQRPRTRHSHSLSESECTYHPGKQKRVTVFVVCLVLN